MEKDVAGTFGDKTDLPNQPPKQQFGFYMYEGSKFYLFFIDSGKKNSDELKAKINGAKRNDQLAVTYLFEVASPENTPYEAVGITLGKKADS